MKCEFCNREIEPEKTERNDGYGIDIRWSCPKCYMFLWAENYRFNKRFGLRYIKDIIENRGETNLENEQKRTEKLNQEIGK